MPPTLIFRTKRINHGQQRRPWHCRACVSLRVTRAQSPAKSPTLPVGAGISRSWQFSPCPSRKALLVARLTRRGQRLHQASSGRSSGVEHNLAKVGVEGSNPFARSSFLPENQRFEPREAREDLVTKLSLLIIVTTLSPVRRLLRASRGNSRREVENFRIISGFDEAAAQWRFIPTGSVTLAWIAVRFIPDQQTHVSNG